MFTVRLGVTFASTGKRQKRILREDGRDDDVCLPDNIVWRYVSRLPAKDKRIPNSTILMLTSLARLQPAEPRVFGLRVLGCGRVDA